MSDKKSDNLKVLYLHGRPSAHPIHLALAKAVADTTTYIDEPIRWQDKNRPQLVNLFISFLNAFLFKNKSSYDVFLIDNLHFTPVFFRVFRLINRNQKIIVHLGSHTLYFISSNRFSRINVLLHKWALNKYDAVICEGDFSTELARSLIKPNGPPIYTTFIGIPAQRLAQLKLNTPDLESGYILIIAGGPSEFRKFYKGLDLMLDGFIKAAPQLRGIRLKIIGDWNEQLKNEYLEQAREKQLIEFLGYQASIENYFTGASLCMHCSRGDAFPTSTIETMAAGIPTMVSEITGTREIAKKIHKNLIVAPDVDSITKALIWYYSLKVTQRTELSLLAKQNAGKYEHDNSVLHYKNTFKNIISNLGVI